MNITLWLVEKCAHDNAIASILELENKSDEGRGLC